MLLLGIDVGTSSIKVSVVDAQSRQTLTQATYPDAETPVIAPQAGWAEQDPDAWWKHVQGAIQKAHASRKYNPADIGAIGIAYQMHGLVTTDEQGNSLRNSIIWCDSRAVPYGERAFKAIGENFCLDHLLNSPGNFTAAKLAWVKEHQPEIYSRIHRVMLPGDYIALKLTGHSTTTVSALSEGVFWDFQRKELSESILRHFDFDTDIFPEVQPVFGEHGTVPPAVAEALGLRAGIPVAYKAGDQPNNALSLNVTEPGEVAATAGTSGVIYAVTNQLMYDPQSRVNSFAHVNYAENDARIGVLLCINGTGILNRWVRDNMAGNRMSYKQMDTVAAEVPAGSEGVMVLPFGNGAERMLNNRTVGAQFAGIDFNRHSDAHLFRAAQEGIAFSFRYGLDIMRSNGLRPDVIRAGKANMFMSSVFTQAFVNATGVPVELYENDGSVGAAMGAGIGAGVYANAAEAFAETKPVKRVDTEPDNQYEMYYGKWREWLGRTMGM